MLALPELSWDSWQPFLGGPTLVETGGGHSVIAGAPATILNAFICVFDIDAAAVSGREGETGVAGATDISPIRIKTFIKVDPETLAHHAFTEVPREILRQYDHKLSSNSHTSSKADSNRKSKRCP